jgi:hypothetical protein
VSQGIRSGDVIADLAPKPGESRIDITCSGAHPDGRGKSDERQDQQIFNEPLSMFITMKPA